MVTHQEISGMSSKNPKHHTAWDLFSIASLQVWKNIMKKQRFGIFTIQTFNADIKQVGMCRDGCNFYVDHQYHTETQGRLGLVCVQDWCSTLIPSPHKRRRAQPRNKVSTGLTSTTVTAGRAPVRNRSCSWLLPPNTRYKLTFLPGCSIDLQAIKEELNRIRIS